MEHPYFEIMYSFHIGDSINVHVVEDNEVIIVDNESGHETFFNARQWVRFIQQIDIIDNAVQWAMTYTPTTFHLHIGHRLYVGVSDRFQNVDIRRWIIRIGLHVSTETAGISLTFTQWENLKKVVEQMIDELPQFNAISPCWHESQHAMESSECNPTPNPVLYHFLLMY